MLDFLTLRNALVGGGIGIVVLLTLIQITPIKLNPLSYIARKLGDALNASQSEKFESFKKQLEALDKKVEDLKNRVEICPIAFLRGRSMEDTILIIDEAQNLDLTALKTVLTRVGKYCKIILLGSLNQIDN